jgi:hypothetical protein
MNPISIITGIWNNITASPLDTALSDMITGAGGLVSDILPVGITMLFVLASPRIVRRIINTFI